MFVDLCKIEIYLKLIYTRYLECFRFLAGLFEQVVGSQFTAST